MMPRYYVRWRTNLEGRSLAVAGWSICDNQRQQMLEIAEFGPGDEEKDHADAICRLLNTQEGIDYDSSCREG